MTQAINTGGPALPVTSENFRNSQSNTGMTLRDHFAAKAMQAEVSEGIPSNREFQDAAAIFSYQMADAMLRAREAA